MPTSTERGEPVVPDAAGRRLSNQITRAYRGTYGAQAGLRTLIRSVTVQMLRTGSSPEAVARALANFVLSCPAPSIDSPTASTEAIRLNVLAALTAEFVSGVAGDVSGEGAAGAATGRQIATSHSSR